MGFHTPGTADEMDHLNRLDTKIPEFTPSLVGIIPDERLEALLQSEFQARRLITNSPIYLSRINVMVKIEVREKSFVVITNRWDVEKRTIRRDDAILYALYQQLKPQGGIQPIKKAPQPREKALKWFYTSN